MRMGVPPSSVNCLEAACFLPFALGADVMRVPRPAAGMITTTFIAGDQYKGGGDRVQIVHAIRRDTVRTVDAQVFLVPLVDLLWISRFEGKAANGGEASRKAQFP